VKMDL